MRQTTAGAVFLWITGSTRGPAGSAHVERARPESAARRMERWTWLKREVGGGIVRHGLLNVLPETSGGVQSIGVRHRVLLEHPQQCLAIRETELWHQPPRVGISARAPMNPWSALTHSYSRYFSYRAATGRMTDHIELGRHGQALLHLFNRQACCKRCRRRRGGVFFSHAERTRGRLTTAVSMKSSFRRPRLASAGFAVSMPSTGQQCYNITSSNGNGERRSVAECCGTHSFRQLFRERPFRARLNGEGGCWLPEAVAMGCDRRR